MRVNIARKGSPLWQASAELARARYARDYGADIRPSPDSFVALCEDGPHGPRPVACGGLTYGGARRLMVETYLGAAAHEYLPAGEDEPLDPAEIVEVGPLASQRSGTGLQLVKMLPALCWCHGAKFLLCTVTATLARTMGRVGINFVRLTPALREALPAEQQGHWGAYYDADPFAGYVDLRDFDVQIAQLAGGGYDLQVTRAVGRAEAVVCA